MIVADTGGLIALLDRDDKHHPRVRQLFEAEKRRWIVPWAVLPEVDYLAARMLGTAVACAFLQDVEDGVFTVDVGLSRDIPRANELLARYSSLELGLVDAVVMAQAERHSAEIIVTTDERDFRAVKLECARQPRLVPLDP